MNIIDSKVVTIEHDYNLDINMLTDTITMIMIITTDTILYYV